MFPKLPKSLIEFFCQTVHAPGGAEGALWPLLLALFILGFVATLGMLLLLSATGPSHADKEALARCGGLRDGQSDFSKEIATILLGSGILEWGINKKTGDTELQPASPIGELSVFVALDEIWVRARNNVDGGCGVDLGLGLKAMKRMRESKKHCTALTNLRTMADTVNRPIPSRYVGGPVTLPSAVEEHDPAKHDQQHSAPKDSLCTGFGAV